MANTTIALTISEDVVAIVGSRERVATRAREALVVALLQNGEISQGKVAELLGISRHDAMLLAAKHGIPSAPESQRALDQELAVVDLIVRERR